MLPGSWPDIRAGGYLEPWRDFSQSRANLAAGKGKSPVDSGCVLTHQVGRGGLCLQERERRVVDCRAHQGSPVTSIFKNGSGTLPICQLLV